MKRIKCEVCGDNWATEPPEICPITGMEWYICDSCRSVFTTIEEEFVHLSENDSVNFNCDELYS